MPHVPRSVDQFNDDLEFLIQEQQRRDRARPYSRRSNDPAMKSWWDNAKTIVPWIIAIGMFLWNAGGSWGTIAANGNRIGELEKTMKADYVTKDSFQPIADGVREIRAMLIEERRRAREDQK